jgi:hypothetical protein
LFIILLYTFVKVSVHLSTLLVHCHTTQLLLAVSFFIFDFVVNIFELIKQVLFIALSFLIEFLQLFFSLVGLLLP